MKKKFITPPMIDALLCNGTNNDNTNCFSPQSNRILLVGTKNENNYRTLMQFDLPLPFSSTIIKGTLNIFVAQNEYPDTSSFLGVFQVLSKWNPQTVTWNEQPLISSSPVDNIAVNNQADTFLAFNITPLLQDWFTNRSANLGIMLRFMDESCGNLLAIPGSKYHDSRFWPYLELNILNHVAQEDRGMLRAISLDPPVVTVSTLPAIQFTLPVNILVYDYSYLVVNSGGNTAMAYLQISPDGATWETQSDTKIINPGTVVSFVPDVIAKFARLAYQSQPASLNTTLQIYTQGRTYN
jgi:hypothetical protein